MTNLGLWMTNKVTNSLKRAFNLVADHLNKGHIRALGVLANSTTQYAIIEIGNQEYITEFHALKSAVTVSSALRVGDRCVLQIINNGQATWLPDYAQNNAADRHEQHENQHNKPAVTKNSHFQRQGQHVKDPRQARTWEPQLTPASKAP